jgi:hypothetical protein
MDTTQKARVIAHCKEYGSITVREATVMLEINSPRKVISEIRQSGEYSVETVSESKVDQYGQRKRWNRYFIKPI